MATEVLGFLLQKLYWGPFSDRCTGVFVEKLIITPIQMAGGVYDFRNFEQV